eukprot:m.120993 g.120993  ORF g.120993 m.120993 type:complete len:68 (+) comp13699_c1_seq1:259-462(+)
MVSAAFERLARNQTVAGVKDSILLFLKHYVAKFTTTVPEKDEKAKLRLLKARIKLAKQACARVALGM